LPWTSSAWSQRSRYSDAKNCALVYRWREVAAEADKQETCDRQISGRKRADSAAWSTCVADSGIVGTELVQVLKGLLDLVVRPIAELIAQGTQCSRLPMRRRCQSLSKIACLGDTSFQVVFVLEP